MSKTEKPYNNIIVNIIRNVINDDVELFLKNLDLIQFNTETDKTVYELFLKIMETGNKYNRIQCCIAAYEFWEEQFEVEIANVPLYVKLFLDIKVSVNLLKFINKNIIKDYSYTEILDTLIEYTETPNSLQAAWKTEQVFGEQNLDLYRELYESSRGNNNFIMSKYFKQMLKEKEEYAKYPYWTFPQENVPNENDIKYPRKKEFEVVITNIHDIVSLLLEGDDDIGTDIEQEEKRTLLTKKLEETPEEKIKEIVKEVLEYYSKLELINNKKIFKIWGPSNTYDALLEEEEQFGGSRMFLSQTAEKSGEGFDTFSDNRSRWFTGKCGKCFKKIRRYPHALRKPLLGGGWIGCFCSPECIRDSILENDLDHLEQMGMLILVVKDIKKYGIQDRIINDEKADEKQIVEQEQEEEKQLALVEMEKQLIVIKEEEKMSLSEEGTESEESEAGIEILFNINSMFLVKDADDLSEIINNYENRFKMIIVLFSKDSDLGTSKYLNDVKTFVEYTPELVFINYDISYYEEIEMNITPNVYFYVSGEKIEEFLPRSSEDMVIKVKQRIKSFLIGNAY